MRVRLSAVVVALALGCVGALLSSQAFTVDTDVHVDWVDAGPGEPATVDGRSLVVERVTFARTAVRESSSGSDSGEKAGNVFLVLDYRAWSEREKGYLEDPVLRTADGTVYTPVAAGGAMTTVEFPSPGFTAYGQLLFDVNLVHLEGAALVDDPSTGFIVYEARRRIDLRLDRSEVLLPSVRPAVVMAQPRTEVTA
jgi:hypothetical protein